ncbi:MAG: hypothetical protein U0517_00500 [Candidatus Andersenbacteria bacterium]
MSKPSTSGPSNFGLDNTPDDAVLRQLKAEPRRIKPDEEKNAAGEFFCPICRSIFYRKSWHTDPRKYEQISQNLDLARKCPACHKTQLDLPEGIVTLSALDTFDKQHREELINLVRNIADRAFRRDPMDRIYKMLDKGNEIVAYTTENQLAVAIGNEVKRALGGDLNIDFSHRDNEIARVVWIAKPLV